MDRRAGQTQRTHGQGTQDLKSVQGQPVNSPAVEAPGQSIEQGTLADVQSTEEYGRKIIRKL